jgi:hypothetical protein
VVVERSADSVEGVRAQASARFVRVAASSSIDVVMQAVGAALELPPSGSCASVNLAPHAAAPGMPMPYVELVDVGTVSLEARGVVTRLGLRQVPDVTDVLTGVVYARGAEATLLPSGAPYVLHVAGGPNLLAFDVVAVAPRDPVDVTVAGEGPAGTLLARGQSVDMSWTPDRADDVLFADVQPAGVRCVLADPGDRAGDGLAHAGVPASFLDDSGSLVVHRVRRAPLVTGGVADGEIRFDFSRALTYVRNW